MKDLIFARVASLGTEERNLLDVAACAGFEFDPVLVGEVLHVGRIPVLQRLAAVEKSHRLVRSVGRRFVFDHHQVGEVLYTALPEMLREEYHGSIASAIEHRQGAAAQDVQGLDGALCVDLAEHHLKGAQGERAIRYLEAALSHLEKGFLNDAAVRLADRALAVPGLVAGRQRCELLLRKADRLDMLGRRDAQRAALEEANALADASGDLALRARARRHRASLASRLSRHDEARAALGEALPLARAAGDRKGEAAATGTLGNILQRLGRLGEAREHHERQLAICREIGDRKGEAEATGSLGVDAHDLGRLAEARDRYERYLALSREIGDRMGEASATGILGTVLYRLGRHEEAREHHERRLALSRQIGDRWSEAMATGNLGCDAWGRGRLGEARDHYERYLAVAREIGDREAAAFAHGNLGVLARCLGRRAEAREHHERFLAAAREIGHRWHEGLALHWFADLAAEEGDPAEPERRYAEALALRREGGHRDGQAETLRAQGALFARLGRLDEARATSSEALSIARELKLPGDELIAAAQLAALPGGDVPAALAAFAAHAGHAELQERMHARFLLWRATHDTVHLAEAQRALNSIVEHAPADCRASMLEHVRLHREIAAAAREQELPFAAEASGAADGEPTGPPAARPPDGA